MSRRELRSGGSGGGNVNEYPKDSRGKKRRLLEVDLNDMPPGSVIENDYVNVVGEGSGSGGGGGVGFVDLEEIDDEVVICSPGRFAEAARNKASRPRRAAIVDEDLQARQAGEALITLTLMTGVPTNETYSNWDPYISVEDFAKVEGNNITKFGSEPEPQKPPSFNCPICLGELDDEMSTKCGHIFCKACIETAVSTQHKCPTCRKKLSKRDIIKIFLPKN